MKRGTVFVTVAVAALVLSAGVVAAANVKTIEDFEDGDTSFSTGDWSGWGIQDDSGGSFTTNSTNPISGSHSGVALADNNFIEPYISTSSGNVNLINASVRIESVPSHTGDSFSVQVTNGSHVGAEISFDTDGGITLANGTQIGTWANGTNTAVNISNIDYENNEYDYKVMNLDTGGVVDEGTNTGFRHPLTKASRVVFNANYNDVINDNNGSKFFMDDIKAKNTKGAVIAGEVTTQSGDAVPNATVDILQVNETTMENDGSTTASEKTERANDLLSKANDPKPNGLCNAALLSASEFSVCPDTTGSITTPSDLSSKYVAAHSPEEWSADDVKLVGTVATVEAGVSLPNPPTFKFDEAPAEVILSVWDPAEERWGELDGVDSDLHGEVIQEGVLVREVDPLNGTVQEFTTDPDPLVSTAPLGEKKYGSPVVLNEGFYWVRPEGGGHGYFIQVGDPVASWSEKYKDIADNLLQQAQYLNDTLNNNTFELSKVVTNSTGQWNFTVPSDVHSVALQAHKGPMDDLVSHFSKWSNATEVQENANDSDYANFFEANTFNGSFYLPLDTKRASPGDTGVILPVEEVSAPRHVNRTDFEDAWERLRNFLNNHTYAETMEFIRSRLDDLTSDEIKQLYSDMYELLKENKDARERAEELAQKNENLTKTLQEYKDQLNSSNESELRKAIEDLEQALQEQQSGVGTDGGTVGIANDTLDASRSFNTDLDSDDVMAVIEFANGSSDTLTPNSQYMRIDHGVLADTVVISGYPVGSSPAVGIQWMAVTGAGVSKATDRARNPSFAGNVPGLDAIDLSTLAPGPDERVDVNLHPSDAGAFGSLQNVTVFDPDGNGLTANVTGDQTADFTTSGAGPHRIEATFSDASGQNFTTTFRVLAESEGRPMDPGLRVVESAVGTYALTGDGLDGGSVDIGSGGATASINARIPDDGDVPERLHVYAHGLSLARDARTNIAVVRGEEGRTVSRNVRVVFHGPSVGSEGIVWRHAQGDRQALPLDSGDIGWVERGPANITVHTVTGDDGRVSIRTIRDPTFLEDVRHWGNLRFQSLPDLNSLPFVGGLLLLFGIPAGWYGRRRAAG